MRSALRNLMSRYSCGLGILGFCMFIFAFCFLSETAPASAETLPCSASKPDPAAPARALASYGKLPLSFEANAGQTDQRVKFLTRGSGYALFLTSNEAVLALRQTASGKPKAQKADPTLQRQVPTSNSESRTSAVLRMKLVGANPAAEISGLEQLPGTSNYFIGSDPKKWRTAVPNYARVRYQNVYPGVDLVYYGNQRQLEYDFVVAPGADPRAIKLDFTGMVGGPGKRAHLRIDHSGDLVLRLNGEEVSFHKPTAYQVVPNSAKATSASTAKDSVEASYVLQSNGQVGIRLAPYDRTRALTIDPAMLVYSSLIGGSSQDAGAAIAVDSAGNAYVTGQTQSPDFPIVGGCLGTCGFGGVRVAFVTKINAAGNALVYSSYLGGSSGALGFGIAVDSSRNAYVTGVAGPGFPIMGQILNACRGTCGTDPLHDDVFVTKINAAGNALVYSSYVGGSDYDEGRGITVDGSGNAYLVGNTSSNNFPVMPPGGIPGACLGMCGTSGNGDAFVTKINAAGNALVYSSYLGGSRGDGPEPFGHAIAVDCSGNAYVTGYTGSSDFPIMGPTVLGIPGACLGTCGTLNNGDAFVTKINAAGNALVYSSYLGGSSGDAGTSIAVDGFGDTYVTGYTISSNFPIVNQIADACLGSCGSGSPFFTDVFVTKIDAAGNALLYSSYIGGSAADVGFGITVDSSRNAYVTGYTGSSDFPRVNQIPGACLGSCGSGGGFYDVFVTEINAVGSAQLYSSYLGGSSAYDLGYGIAVDSSLNAYVTGNTESSDFPVVPVGVGIPGACLGTCGHGSPGGDAFVTGISSVPSTPVFFNNFGIGCGNIYLCGAAGWFVSGLSSAAPTRPLIQAAQFQVLHSGPVSQIDVAVSYVSGVNSFYVSIYTDNGGLPGTLIASYNNLSSSIPFGSCTGVVTIPNITGLTLAAGNNYWIVVGPTSLSSNTWEVWNLNSLSGMGMHLYSTDGGITWINLGQQILAAFDIL
jgi:Beta-propeller repeat